MWLKLPVTLVLGIPEALASTNPYTHMCTHIHRIRTVRKFRASHDPAKLLLGISLKWSIAYYKDAFPSMFRVALLTMTRSGVTIDVHQRING